MSAVEVVRPDAVVPMRIGDRLVDEFNTTAVELTETGFAPVVNFGQGEARWFRLDDRFDSFDEASDAAGREWDEAFA